MDEPSVRIRKYIESLELALKEAKTKAEQLSEVSKITRLAELYLKDAKYYMSLGDYITSASCVAYAEGLVDALRMLGLTEFSWRKPDVHKVFVAGTFDLLHPGHVYFLYRAYELGLPYVAISRDANVMKNKGRLPVMGEHDRLAVVSSLKPVYRAFLGDLEDYLKPLIDIRPDVVLLGPDQSIDEIQLMKELEKRGLPAVKITRVRERLDSYSTTQLIKKACNTLGNTSNSK